MYAIRSYYEAAAILSATSGLVTMVRKLAFTPSWKGFLNWKLPFHSGVVSAQMLVKG